MAGAGRSNRPSRPVLGAVRLQVVDRCSSSVRCSCSATASPRSVRPEISLREPGNRNNNTCSFPNHSHIGQPLPVGAERHGQTDKTFIGACVCARRIADASVGPGLHAQKQARGERSVELTRGAGTRSAPAAPPST